MNFKKSDLEDILIYVLEKKSNCNPIVKCPVFYDQKWVVHSNVIN
jgi:hypothetical protein